MNMYERLRQVIATRKFETEEDSMLDDDQLYNMRMKNIISGKPLPQWVYKENFILDTDYCRSCLKYSE